jgi:UDP-N-acetylglucosamine--N-acetylmuramyl-(pentapeptide) pyrophosphoryl-undecaprenol N-acetylglucosamine transferase
MAGLVGHSPKAKAVMIMAGGTGGHVYPALAVAAELGPAGAAVTWLGTRRGLEARVVPQAGIPLDFITIAGLRGKGIPTALAAPFRLLRALLQSLVAIRRRRPDVVLGMGGFAAGPGGLAAWLLRKPLVIHEQNAVPGLTNRLLARLARRVLEAFPGSFPTAVPAEHVGNPVRRVVLEVPPPEQRVATRLGALRLLVLGGSQGAQALNRVVPAALGRKGDPGAVDVWHQAGVGHLEATQAWYREEEVTGRVVGYIEEMAEAYAWADVVLCRAGAMTIAELSAVGVASILVPLPHAVDDHQTRNARYLADPGAAILLPQSDLDAPRLASLLKELAASRERLTSMARTARALARPDAARQVANTCLEAADG